MSALVLVRVVGPGFVAGFETDGIVRRTAPILKQMRGWTDKRAREYMARKGWKASVIPDQIRMELTHEADSRATA